MLQLKETLGIIEKNYSKLYEESQFFATVYKGTLLNFAVDGKDTGSIVLWHHNYAVKNWISAECLL